MGAFQFSTWLVLAAVWCSYPEAQGLGVNWGTQATHPLSPKIVAQLLKDNGIQKVKIFDADRNILTALAGINIEVMVAIPNDMLGIMNDYDSAKKWVNLNVSRYLFNGGVNIKYVAVGNEPFLSTYNGSFLNVTFPALYNIQKALYDAGVGNTIKATIPLNADVYNSPASNPVPSAGTFRADISGLMTEIVQFYNQIGAPFTTNIYPFLSLYDDPNFPIDFAFFDGLSNTIVDNGHVYTNVFDANFDTLVSALNALGYGSTPIIVGEVGWPTDGDIHATAVYAQRFYNGLLKHLANNVGTPLRPNQYLEVYMFSLIDEDAKSIAPGNFEPHWGILRYDGQPKYLMDLSGQGQDTTLVPAKGVRYLTERWCVLNPNANRNLSLLGNNINYACSRSDCTSLGYGSTCNGLDLYGNASYAFNMYYQVQDQNELSCYFQGLAVETTLNPSTGSCNFIIEIVSAAPSLLLSLSGIILMTVLAFIPFILVS